MIIQGGNYLMIDKEAEYGALRQEILDTINARDNYVIAMYTITIAIMCAAFELENTILFLLPYVILYAFQNTIATKSENMIVLGSYIAVCLEEGEGWESKNAEIKKIMGTSKLFKRPEGILAKLIGRIGSVQLGLLCSLFCVVYSVKELIFATSAAEMIRPGCCIIVAIVLYRLICVQTKDVFNAWRRRKVYIDSLNNYEKGKLEGIERKSRELV